MSFSHFRPVLHWLLIIPYKIRTLIAIKSLIQTRREEKDEVTVGPIAAIIVSITIAMMEGHSIKMIGVGISRVRQILDIVNHSLVNVHHSCQLLQTLHATIAIAENTAASNSNATIWCIDSGATHHMISDSSGSQMSNITQVLILSLLEMVLTYLLPIYDRNLTIPNGSLGIKEVLCIPAIKKNHLSIKRFCKDNCYFLYWKLTVFFFFFFVKDNKTGIALLIGTSSGSLYHIHADSKVSVKIITVIFYIGSLRFFFFFFLKDNKTGIALLIGTSSGSLYHIHADSKVSVKIVFYGERTTPDVWHGRFGHPSNAVFLVFLNKYHSPIHCK